MTDREPIRKLFWRDIRDKISLLDPVFARIVDELNPDDSLPMFLVYYPYGTLVADTESTYLPDHDGVFRRLTDPAMSRELIQELGYGSDGLPMGMVLEKRLEYYIDLPQCSMTIPWLVYGPGALFPYTSILGQTSNRNYSPNGLLNITSGARSVFMLPNIGCSVNHMNLQRDFNVKKSAPKMLYDHWYVFNEIVKSESIRSDWCSSVIFFSEKWLRMIQQDKAWLPLKNYILERAWRQFEYDRNRIYYDIAFSLIQKKRNLKPNPYLTDTARHLYSIALGCVPGFSPAIDDDCLPVQLLQKAFINSYNLSKYIPTVMIPRNYSFESNDLPVYYSFQHPSTHMFSPKSRKVSSTLYEMRELVHIMKIFGEELSRDHAICSDTILNNVATTVKFGYFHNEVDSHQVIRHSSDIQQYDTRFNIILADTQMGKSSFAQDSKFLRGCISIG